MLLLFLGWTHIPTGPRGQSRTARPTGVLELPDATRRSGGHSASFTGPGADRRAGLGSADNRGSAGDCTSPNGTVWSRIGPGDDPQTHQDLDTRQLAKIGIHLGTKQESKKSPAPQSCSSANQDRQAGRQDLASCGAVQGYICRRELVYDSIMRRCTDIHLEPKEDELQVRLRIDGIMYPTEPFDRAIGEAIVNIFKVLSAMDITERRRPQDGSFGALVENREIDFRVATQGTRFGEKMSLRILDQSNSVKNLEQLGMRKQLQESIEKIIAQPHGLFPELWSDWSR